MSAATAAPASGALAPAVSASVEQLFSILNAAQKHTQAGSALSVTAEAAYSAQTADATASLGVSASVSTPGAAQQIADAVTRVNAMFAAVDPGTAKASADGAVTVTVGDGSGALLAPPQSLGLPSGLPAPATVAQALGQLSKSSVAGVAAAASSLLGRLLPSADGKTAGFMGTAAEMATSDLVTQGGPLGIAALLVGTDRDTDILQVAESMVGSAPPLDAAGQASIARELASTYNGSFTLVKIAQVPTGVQAAFLNGIDEYVYHTSSNQAWAVVDTQPTVTTTVVAQTTTSSGSS